MHGKPKETVETVTRSRTEDDLESMTPEERRHLLIELERQGYAPTLRTVGED